LIEIFPTGDYDNLLIPIGVGVIAQNFIIWPIRIIKSHFKLW
jgi:hypothetical protein